MLTEAAGFIARGHRVVVYAARGARILAEAPRFGVPVVAAAHRSQARRAASRALGARARGTHRSTSINAHSSTDAWLAAIACRWLDFRAGRDPRWCARGTCRSRCPTTR